MINLMAVSSRSHISICKKKKQTKKQNAILEMRFWDYDEMSRCHAQSFNKKALCLISVLLRNFLLPPPHIMQPISGSPKVQIKGDRGTRNHQGEK